MTDPVTTQTPPEPTVTQAPTVTTTEPGTTPAPTVTAAPGTTPAPGVTAPPAAQEAFALADLKIPEGIEVAEADYKNFSEIMSKDMTPKDRAQALLDLQADVAKRTSEKGSEAWANLQQTWVDEVAKDAEIGGANLENSKALIGGLLTKFPVEGVREAFDLTGAGNNPAIVKFMVQVAKSMGEGQLAVGAPASPPMSQAQKLYPTMKG